MSENSLETMRHSAAHIMAAAVQSLWPEAKFDIGPDTAEGFYYDFDMEHRLNQEDLKKIEKAMRKMIGRKLPFERRELSRKEAEAYFAEKGQSFKLQRLADIPEDETVSLYSSGDFTDLCRGPHLEHSGQIGAVKLLSVAGSYFRGDEKLPMLQRIYGTAFPSQEELQDYLNRIEEAKKRDHRKLGAELELYSIRGNSTKPGMLATPKGRAYAILSRNSVNGRTPITDMKCSIPHT